MAASEDTRALRRLVQIETELYPVIRSAIHRVAEKVATAEHLPSSMEAEATLTAAVTSSGLLRLKRYWSDEVQTSILPAVLRAMLRSADVVQRWLPPAVSNTLDIRNRQSVAEALLSALAEILDSIGDTMAAESMNAMQKSFALGEGPAKAAARVRRALDISEDRATMIARTTATTVANMADQMVSQEVEDAGFEHEIEWLATRDARTREAHREANGQRIKPGEKFSLVDDKGRLVHMAFPGDPSAPADLVIGCRCTTIIRLTEDHPLI